jgi:hypothetical protein
VKTLLVALCVLLGCTAPIEVVSDGGTEPSIALRDVRFVSSHGDQVFVHGRAKSLIYEREGGAAHATDVALVFPREGRAGQVNVTAPRANGIPLEERVRGEGGVRFSNARGDHGVTEVVDYDGRRGEASGDKTIFLWGPGFTLGAPGFRWKAVDDSLDLGPASVTTREKQP